jgi:hypothetical protein
MTEWITGAIARWEVIWWNKKKKRFTVMEFGNDLASAEDLYARVLGAEKPFATLRCTNVGFPPPEKYRPFIRKERQERGTKIVKRRGKRVRVKIIKTVEVEVTPMAEVNLKGVWWCPYCRKMRKFRRQDGMTYSDSSGDYYLDGVVWCCPVCSITHTNHHVRKWNPAAQKMPFRKIRATRSRRSNGRTTRRRSRSR